VPVGTGPPVGFGPAVPEGKPEGKLEGKPEGNPPVGKVGRPVPEGTAVSEAARAAMDGSGLPVPEGIGNEPVPVGMGGNEPVPAGKVKEPVPEN